MGEEEPWPTLTALEGTERRRREPSEPPCVVTCEPQQTSLSPESASPHSSQPVRSGFLDRASGGWEARRCLLPNGTTSVRLSLWDPRRASEGLGYPRPLFPPCQGRPCPCPPRRVRKVRHGLRRGQRDLQGHRAPPCFVRAQPSDTLSWVWGNALLIKLPKVTDVGWGGVGWEEGTREK